MPSATISVQYVNQPKAGKKEGNVKTTNGEYYGVKPAMLAQFSPGGTYTVEYDSRMWNSKEFKSITTITAAQAPAAGTGGGNYGPKDDTTAERIFVQGILQAFITAGKIEPTGVAVTGAVKTLRAVWADTLGKPKTATQETMNDEIPF